MKKNLISILLLLVLTVFGSSLYTNPTNLKFDGTILYANTKSYSFTGYFFEIGYGEVDKQLLGILSYKYSLDNQHYILYKIADLKNTYGLELEVLVSPTDKFRLSVSAGLRSNIDKSSAFSFYIRDLTLFAMSLDNFKIPDGTIEYEKFFNENFGISLFVSYLKNSLFEFGGKLLFGEFGIIKYPYIGVANFYNPTTTKSVFGFVLGTEISFDTITLNGNVFWNTEKDPTSAVQELKNDYVITLTGNIKF